MGQCQSHRMGAASSDDRINLFISNNDSITSLTGDHRFNNILTRNHQKHGNFKHCRKLSKLKNSLCECFRSKFKKLQDSESDMESNSNNEIAIVQPSNCEMSKSLNTESRVRQSSDTYSIFTESIPKDIQEIHIQLTELKRLLSRPDIVTESIEKRDKSCQTEILNDKFNHQKHYEVFNQHVEHNNLLIHLNNKIKIIECLNKELAILKAQQSRRNVDIEPKYFDQLILLLKSIRQNKHVDDCDLSRLDEGIALIMTLSLSSRNQTDKSNIAIINPCTKKASDLFKIEQNLTPYIHQMKHSQDRQETNLIYFLGKSPIPFLSVIPLPPTMISLSNVKEYTKSVLEKDIKFRYFFKTTHSDFGTTKEEIVNDQDIVPIYEGKIILYIQQC